VGLGREGFAGFQQGLEAGDDIRPTDADHLDHGAARLEAVVNHRQLHALRDGLDMAACQDARRTRRAPPTAVQVTAFGCFTGTAACPPFADSCCPSWVRHTIRAGTI
jgi:hypothetical protein